jgi:hypothetical protein
MTIHTAITAVAVMAFSRWFLHHSLRDVETALVRRPKQERGTLASLMRMNHEWRPQNRGLCVFSLLWQ